MRPRHNVCVHGGATHVAAVNCVAWAALLVLACGPRLGNNDDGTPGMPPTTHVDPTTSSSTSETTTTLPPTGGSTIADTTTTGPTESSSTGGETLWDAPELITVLDGDPWVLEAGHLVLASTHLHVGSREGPAAGMHWVIDRATGEVVSTSIVGGQVVATASFVYAGGYRTGMVGEEWAVTRMDHDGANEIEIFVSPNPLHTFAASSDEAFIQEFVDFETFSLWHVEDGMSTPELLLDLGQRSLGTAIYDEGRLLTQDTLGPELLALDLDSLEFDPVLTPPAPVWALSATTTYLLLASEHAVHRAPRADLEPEALWNGEPLVQRIVADDETLLWNTIFNSVDTLHAIRTSGTELEMVPVENDPGAIVGLAMTDDAVYILRGPHTDLETSHSGSLWVVARPPGD